MVLLIVIFNGIYAQQSLHTQYVRSQHAVSMLSTNAKFAWAEGAGAYSYVPIQIPESVRLNQSSISGNSLNLYVAEFGDAFEFVDFNILGNWPNQTGSVVMSVRNNGSHIIIRPAALISLSRFGFYFNTSGVDYLTITNSANESFDISQDLVFSSCASCTYDDEGASTLASGGVSTGRIDIPVLSSGIYSGYLQINASPTSSNSQFENVTFNIPITVVR